MSNAETTTEKRPGSAIAILRAELGMLLPELQNALPSHISPERFGRVILTAIGSNPELLEVDRRSVWKACMQAANDGLLPDNKEGAIVVRWDNRLRQKAAAWQPMIAGVRKKAVNAGMIATWDVQAVYANDDFEFELGDEPFIRHRPALSNRGNLVAVYSIATLKTGEKSREVMGVEEIFEIRDQFSAGWNSYKAGKIKTTPWASAVGEMAKKTVGHRHAKVLPLSSDIRELLLKGDDLKGAQDGLPAGEPGKPRLSIHSKFDLLAGPDPTTTETIEYDKETGEISNTSGVSPTQEAASQDVKSDAGPASTSSQTAGPAPAKEERDASARGKMTATSGHSPEADKKRAALLADLLKNGDEIAATEGMASVRFWINNDCSGDEIALFTPEHHARWEAIAKKAGRMN